MLKNKKILLTGANGGLGSELKNLLIKEQAKLFCLANNKVNEDDIVIDLINDIEKAYELIEKEQFDIIINLAGINSFAEFNSLSDKQVESILNINLKAPMLLSKHALNSYMLKNKSGQIINIGSAIGNIPMPYYASYAASKAGLKAFSESLYRELKPEGINVSYIAPRAIKTKINSDEALEFMQKTNTNLDEPTIVAKQILTAIKNKQPRLNIGVPESFFAKVNAVFPKMVDSEMFKQAKIAKQILTKK